MNCPNCNSLNPDDAEWCSLCLARFEATQPQVPALQPTDPDIEPVWQKIAADAGSGPGVEVQSGPIIRRQEGLVWRCSSCDTQNPLDVEVCPVCGTSFFDSFKPPDEHVPGRTDANPQFALLLSIFPGAGHLYLGRGAEGFTRMFLAAWWLITIILLPSGLPLLLLAKIVYLIALLALIGISAVEASRAAADPKAPPLLTTRMVLYGSMTLVGVLVLSSVAASIAIRR